MDLNNETALIIGGGEIETENLRWIFLQYRPSLLIAADSGLAVFEKTGIVPDIVLGDFDSLKDSDLLTKYEKFNCEIQRFPCEKDYTDMRLACDTAIMRGCRRLIILGATGSRLDHTLANVLLLSYLLEKGIEGLILNSKNRLRCVGVGKYQFFKKETYASYISFLPVLNIEVIFQLKGFKYDADRLVMNSSDIITLSNEIKAECAELTVLEGMLLIVESED